MHIFNMEQLSYQKQYCSVYYSIEKHKIVYFDTGTL